MVIPDASNFEGRIRRIVRSVASPVVVVAIATLLYVAVALSIANSNRDSGLNDSRPRFETPRPASLPALPTYEEDLYTTLVTYRPVEFDESLKSLAVELEIRPAPIVGEWTADSFEILGNRVLLQMPGAQILNGEQSSSILLEGSASTVSYRLRQELAKKASGTTNEFIQTLNANAASRLEDVHLYSPIDVMLQSQTYGRPFRVTDNNFWFPFDSYGFSLNLQATLRPLIDIAGQQFNYDGPLGVMPINLFPNQGVIAASQLFRHQVGDWEIRSKPTAYLELDGSATFEDVAESWEVGLGSVHYHARRPFSVKVLTAVFGLVYLASAVALIVVVRQIACGSRPPTGNMLVWAAALIFASVSLRQGLPGDIPVGVLFDWVFLFPILLVSIASTLYLAVKWVQRADYTP